MRKSHFVGFQHNSTEVDINFFLMTFPKIKEDGLSSLSQNHQNRIVKLFTNNLPLFNQLYKKLSNKVFDILQSAKIQTYQHDQQLSPLNYAYILMKGNINIDDSIVSPIILISPDTHVNKTITCKSLSSTFIQFELPIFNQYFQALLYKKQNLLKAIKKATPFIHLTPNQQNDLCFSGRIIDCSNSTVIFKQNQPINKSIFHMTSGFPLIYLILSGTYVLSVYDKSNKDERKQQLLKYLNNKPTNSEIPLMQKPSIKQLRQISEVEGNIVFGIQDLLEDKATRNWTMSMKSSSGQVFEIDLGYYSGWENFKEFIGIGQDNNLKQCLKVEEKRRIQESEKQKTCSQEQQLTSLQKEVETIMQHKDQINRKIEKQFIFHEVPQKSLIEEFSEFDPFFRKLLKIKLFKETQPTHRNSILNEQYRKKNEGIYLNSLRKGSCADKSFLIFHNYTKRSKRQKEFQSQFHSSNHSTTNTSFRACSTSQNAVRNTKRKLKSSRRNNLRPNTSFEQ